MKVIESVRGVVERSRNVKLNRDRLRAFAKAFRRLEVRNWMSECPVDLSNLSREQKLAFLFVFNSISFSYWGEPKWAVTHGETTYDRGTWCMIACLKKAIDEGRSILDPAYLSQISEAGLGRILAGNVEIPLLGERARILREVGEQTEKTGGFGKVVQTGGVDALELLAFIVENFPSFDDSVDSTYFYKRAQLLVSDVARVLDITGVEQLTACADYILPMVLRRLGILEYSPGLAERVDRREELAAGSVEEIEIRADTILAVQELSELIGLTAMQINDYLWLAKGDVPPELRHDYHRIRTTNY